MSDEKTGRKSGHGFYWARSPALGWIVVEFFAPDSWYVPGDNRDWKKDEFLEIDERQIEREVKPLPHVRDVLNK